MLAVVLLSMALTLVLGWPTLLLLRRTQVIQKISEYAPETHQAKQGTPTMGGLMMLAAALIVFALYNSGVLGGGPAAVYPACIPLAMWLVLGFATIGFLDDYVIPKRSSKRGLGWVPKLVLQFAVAVPVCWYSMWNWLPTVPARLVQGSYGTPWGGVLGGTAGVLIAAIIIVGLANAFNFTDGLDGLGAGTMTFAAVGLALTGAPMLLACVLVGVCLGFLFYNAPPAKVFMGDTGSLPLGALFAWALLNTPRVSPWAFLLCGVFLIELIPVPIQIASVKLFKRRVFFRTPIHHAFEEKGVPETRVTAGFVLAQGVCTLVYVVLAR